MRVHLRSLSHATLATAVALLALPINWAQAQQLQMLPPTNYGTSQPCNITNGILTYSGSPNTDPNSNKPISAINCVSGVTLENGGNITTPGNVSAANSTIGTVVTSTPASGSLQSWGNGLLTVNGTSDVTNWDAYYGSTDSMTGKFYQLIGTYHGWDPNSIYIGAYNATNTTPSWGNIPTTSVSFGGWWSGVPSIPSSSPAMIVDLVNRVVGIGTTLPQEPLHISTVTGAAAAIQLETPGTGPVDQSVINFVTKGNSYTLSDTNHPNNLGWQIYARGDHFLDSSTGTQRPDLLGFSFWNGHYWTNNTLTLAPPTADFPHGIVGIGTLTPKETLDVNGVINLGARLWMQRDDTNYSWIGAQSADGSQPTTADGDAQRDAIGIESTSAGLVQKLHFRTNDVERMLIDNAGNVGIGSSVPVGNLDIENGQGTAALCLNGTCITKLIGGMNAASQAKLATAVQNDVTADLNVSCPTGQILTGLSAGQPVCAPMPTALPACGPNQLVGTDASGALTCLNVPPPTKTVGTPLYMTGYQWWYQGGAGVIGTTPAQYNATLLAGIQAWPPLNGNAAGQTANYNGCALDQYGNLPASTMSGPGASTNLQQCGDFICYAVSGGMAPALVQLGGSCAAQPDGSVTNCGVMGGAGFGISWNCMFRATN